MQYLQKRTYVVTPVNTRCNLSCHYCYHAHSRDSAKPVVMSHEILEKFISTSIGTARDIFYIWHGGEPLFAGKGYFESIVSLQNKYNRDTKIKNGVQTNATLIDEEWAHLLIENNFNISISLDGDSVLHNIHRIRENGTGSYADVMKGVEILQRIKPDIKLGVIATINRHNVRYPDLVYNSLVRNTWSKGMEPNSCNPTIAGHELSPPLNDLLKFWKRCFDIWWDEDNPNVHIRLFKDVIRGCFGRVPLDCAWRKFGCRFIMSMDASGDVYTCSRFLGQSIAHLGNVLARGIDEIIDSPKTDEIYQAKASLNDDCKSCEWINTCGGGCPYIRWLHGGYQSKYYEFNIRKQFFSYVKGHLAGYLNNKANHISDNDEYNHSYVAHNGG